jgi:UDP-N-acetylmuramyl pentapeptide phosphotransferase/UDP-N-acetylglucosamine-1-phosphate transferase
MVAMIMFLSLGYVAFKVGDTEVLSGAFIMMGAILGFLLFNFPAGLIFLGDGGAYFIGFMLAELAILLVMRHPEISAWYPVLLFFYPIFEMIFSIYRRRFVRGVSPGVPDGVHLHMLIYKRVVRWAVDAHTARDLTRRNSYTSPYLWGLSLIAVVPATLFWGKTAYLICFVVAFAVFYVWVYTRIIRFQPLPFAMSRKHKKKS